MADIAKWALLVAGIVILIALVVSLPFNEFINTSEFASGLSGIVGIAGAFFRSARGIINNFLTPFGRTMLSGIMIYLFSKFFITNTIRITTGIYHFIFK